MGELVGKTVVVTGAGRGVGRDIALALGNAGANVVVNYSTSKDGAAGVVEELRASAGQGLACKADISQRADVEHLFGTTLDAYGRVDILVNNAGINIDSALLAMSEDDWDAVLAVNLKGAFLCTQAAGKAMCEAKSGSIVNISAVTSLEARPGAANYCASKAGVNALTQCAALELAPHVRVNCLALGFFRSEAVERHFTDAQISAVVDATPLQRMGEFGEISSAVMFLASTASSFITGQTIIIDGGKVRR